MTGPRLTAAEAERLRTWAIEIAHALLPLDTTSHREGHDLRFSGQGGFSVDTSSGAWFSFGAGRGGHSTLGLIGFLRPAFSPIDIHGWASAWLGAHAGTSSCTGGAAGDDDAADGAAKAASRAEAEHCLQRAIDPCGTVVETYLRSRGLAPPYPAGIRFLADARVGESAMVAELTTHGRTVGVLLTYLDPDGAKSLVTPHRQRFNLEKQPGAVFVVSEPDGGVKDLHYDTIYCEGLENALSLARIGRRGWRIRGLPGIAALRHQTVRPGERILVFRDGDRAGSPADAGLAAGIDHLLLQDASVSVTNTPPGADANSILCSTAGLSGLITLIAAATAAVLSDAGEFARLAQLDSLAFDREHRATAKRLRISVSTLRREVAKLKPKAPATPDGADGDVREDDPPWPGAVDLGAALDAAYAEIRRYVALSETQAAVAAVWSALSHLVHNDAVALPVCARLYITSLIPDCGKSTLLEIVCELARRGRLYSSFTASSVFRLIDTAKPTLALDEVDQVLADPKGEMLAVLNASHRRRSAMVIRSEQDTNGRWKVAEYSVWGAIVMAGIGALPATQDSRAITIRLEPAPEGVALAHLEHGTSPALVDIRRQLAAWDKALASLPKTPLPAGLHNRRGDNWGPLFSIAELAGGPWPDRIRAAAEEVRRMPTRQPQLITLLSAIKTAFNETEFGAGEPVRLTTPDLVGKLLADEEAGWDEINRGRAISAAWLRERLTGLLDPPGSQKWDAPGSLPGGRLWFRGYTIRQFRHAFEQYLSRPIPPFSSVSSASDAAETMQYDDLTRENAVADERADTLGHPPHHPPQRENPVADERVGPAVHPPHHPPQKNTHDTNGLSGYFADEAVVAVEKEGMREKKEEGKEATAAEPASAPQPPENEALPQVLPPTPSDPTPEPRRRGGKIADIILKTRQRHPDWSAARIARRVARSESVVRKVLDGAAPPAAGTGSGVAPTDPARGRP